MPELKRRAFVLSSAAPAAAHPVSISHDFTTEYRFLFIDKGHKADELPVHNRKAVGNQKEEGGGEV
jgi:hypothetical protein